MLGRKKTATAEDWQQAWAAERCFPAGALSALVEQAAAELTAAIQGQQVAVAWSGGKDSRALEVICRMVGLDTGVIITSPLQYPSVTRWLAEHQPPGIVTRVHGPDLHYLREHPAFLFPHGQPRQRYREMVYLAGQKAFMRERDITLFITGHRRADGNFCRLESKYHYGAGGVVRFSPLRDWPHEAVLQVIKDSALTLPPVYEMPDGWRYSATDWPRRPKVATVDEGFSLTWDIDPDIVREAAGVLSQAREFMVRQGLQ